MFLALICALLGLLSAYFDSYYLAATLGWVAGTLMFFFGESCLILILTGILTAAFYFSTFFILPTFLAIGYSVTWAVLGIGVGHLIFLFVVLIKSKISN